VLAVPGHADGRMHRLVVEALAVDRVDAEELVVALLELPGEGLDHLEVLPLKKAAHAGRIHQYRGAAMPENQHLHVLAQTRAVPPYVFSVHNYHKKTSVEG